MRYLTTIATLAIAAYAAAADTKFDVAVIKPTAPGGLPQYCGPPFGAQPGPPQYVLLNCTVRDLVGRSWSPRKLEFSVPADPAWISTAHYDINAKSAAAVNPTQHDKMFQPLLEDRFRLKWHREKRELLVYSLTVAKGGVKLSLTRAGTCIPWGPQSAAAGFPGTFDIHLKFARDSSLAFGGLPDRPGQAAETAACPNIFTAIRSLGLNIVPGKGPVNVFVIDSVQRPSEN